MKRDIDTQKEIKAHVRGCHGSYIESQIKIYTENVIKRNTDTYKYTLTHINQSNKKNSHIQKRSNTNR